MQGITCETSKLIRFKICPGSNGFLLSAITFIYLLVKKVFSKFEYPRKLATILQHRGGAVLTVMLLENIFRKELIPFFDSYHKYYMPSVWVTLLTVATGQVAGVIIKQIPVLKKIV